MGPIKAAAILSRRREYLENQLDERRGSSSALAFASDEIEAIDLALVLLRNATVKEVTRISSAEAVLRDLRRALPAPLPPELQIHAQRADAVLAVCDEVS